MDEAVNGARPALLVRQAVLADLALVAPLFDAYRQLYGRASDLAAATAFLRDRFAHGESVIFLALDGTEPPALRRGGVGSALLQAATDHARSLGAVRVSLNTDVANATAQATYEARGWKRDREYFAYHFTALS
jgi:GNAT superfamily N-acetyltransferase